MEAIKFKNGNCLSVMSMCCMRYAGEGQEARADLGKTKHGRSTQEEEVRHDMSRRRFRAQQFTSRCVCGCAETAQKAGSFGNGNGIP